MNILIACVITLLVFITLYRIQKSNNKEGMVGLVGEDDRNKAKTFSNGKNMATLQETKKYIEENQSETTFK